MNKHLLVAGLLALGACRTESGNWVGDYVTRNDFEAVVGWGADAATLTKERAHSGQYAVRVDRDHEYGQTFDVTLGQASVHALRGVELQAWALLPGPSATGAIVLQVIDPANNGFRVVHSEQLNLTDQVKDYNKWAPVQQRFMLPAGLPGQYRLRVFLWRNNATEPVYLDDLALKALE